jgi:pantothenate synthetase
MRFGERCGMISNATKMAATSVESALATIDASLERVRSQLASLEARGKTHLESYQKLANSCQLMERKRLELARASAAKANSLLPAFALDNNAAEAD